VAAVAPTAAPSSSEAALNGSALRASETRERAATGTSRHTDEDGGGGGSARAHERRVPTAESALAAVAVTPVKKRLSRLVRVRTRTIRRFKARTLLGRRPLAL